MYPRNEYIKSAGPSAYKRAGRAQKLLTNREKQRKITQEGLLDILGI